MKKITTLLLTVFVATQINQPALAFSAKKDNTYIHTDYDTGERLPCLRRCLSDIDCVRSKGNRS